VKEFVGSCDLFVLMQRIIVIALMVSFNHALLIPISMWFSISMDFIIDLPTSSPYDSILVVVDCLMKMINFIPCTKIIIGKGINKLFFDHIFKYHGFLEDIIFYCGPQFAFKF
jgi:hypothetical protein